MPPPSGRCFPGQPTVRRCFWSGWLRVKVLFLIVTAPATLAFDVWAPLPRAEPAASTLTSSTTSSPAAVRRG